MHQVKVSPFNKGTFQFTYKTRTLPGPLKLVLPPTKFGPKVTPQMRVIVTKLLTKVLKSSKNFVSVNHED